MHGIIIPSNAEAIELVLLILFPTLLWIADKLEDMYHKKEKAKYYMD